MKVFVPSGTSSVRGENGAFSQPRVCMHVRGVARTDGRVLREAVALSEAGYAVSIVDVENDIYRPVEEDISDIRMRHIIKPNWLVPVRFKPWRLVRTVQKFLYSTFMLMRMPADIYHAHDENALPACAIAALWHHKPLIFDAHELPLKDLGKTVPHWLYKVAVRVFALLVQGCAGVITVSDPISQEIRKSYRVPHVSVIRNVPVYRAVSKSDRLRQALNLGPQMHIALYQGNVQPDRGLDVLVHAAKFLEPGIVIVLMGKGVGTTPDRLQALIAAEGVADRVKILGPVPYAELLDWTASADIGLNVLPPHYSLSIRMCLPNKFFEYLMAGLPVLTSPLDAVADIVRTYDVGRVVDSLAPRDVAAAINEILNDHDGLICMRCNALNAAEQELHWGKESQQLIGLYQEICARWNARNETELSIQHSLEHPQG
jgi:glycosyltransferase involved in cell wall biosynthesis